MNLEHFPPGSVTYEPGQPGRKPTVRTSTEGTTTVEIHDMAIEPVPPRFRVTFFIGYSHGSVGPKENDHLHLTIQRPAETADLSYAEVEQQAARHVPDALRALADALEQDIARTDRERPRPQV